MTTVRAFGPGDVSAANALTNWYIEHTAVHFALEPMPEADFEALWRVGSRTYPWFAAEVDGAFAGYAKAGPWRERAAYRWTCETGIYVSLGLERRGVGLALYGALLEALRGAGFHSVVAGLTLPNPGSVALHERVGFRPVGRFESVGYKFSRWHDVEFWQLSLGGGGSCGVESAVEVE